MKVCRLFGVPESSTSLGSPVFEEVAKNSFFKREHDEDPVLERSKKLITEAGMANIDS